MLKKRNIRVADKKIAQEYDSMTAYQEQEHDRRTRDSVPLTTGTLRHPGWRTLRALTLSRRATLSAEIEVDTVAEFTHCGTHKIIA